MVSISNPNVLCNCGFSYIISFGGGNGYLCFKCRIGCGKKQYCSLVNFPLVRWIWAVRLFWHFWISLWYSVLSTLLFRTGIWKQWFAMFLLLPELGKNLDQILAKCFRVSSSIHVFYPFSEVIAVV